MTPGGTPPPLPPVGVRALRSGPALTVGLALLIATVAASQYAVPAPTLFLLITVLYAAALGGWKAGLASALVALFYLAWLLSRPGGVAQYAPLNRLFLVVGGVALPLAILAGWVLHRLLQRERGRDWHRATVGAYQSGTADARVDADRQFRTFVEQVDDYAIFTAGPDGHSTTWNEGVRRLLGYDEAEFIGQPASLIFTPEDRERGEPERELRTAIERGGASDDRWLVRKDGSRFWATGITTRVTDAAGQLLGFSRVFRDRTAEKAVQDRLRSSEERLRVALQAARMGIWRWDLPTNTQRVDGSMARLLGLGDGEIVETYETFREHIHPEDREQVDAAFRHTAQTGDDMHVEFRVVWPDGSLHWLLDHGQLVRDDTGRPAYLTGAVLDVTDRKLAEERLVQAQRMDAVGHMAGGIAHEINNMMTVVLGFSALLLERLHDDPRIADVRQIHGAAERAAAITRQLLAFSRRQLMRPQVLEVNELVRELEPVLRRVLGADKVLVTDLATELGRVRADRGQLEQVLLNLTLNARDAMPTGGAVTMRTRNVDIPPRVGSRPLEDELPAGRYVLLEVSDNGHGMDAAIQARVFEPFFTTKPMGRGTGLGLATAFGIVRQSGGTMRVHSATGAGTTFNVYLPEVPDAAAVESEGAESAAPERGDETVLVVEDEAAVRRFTCQLLQTLGYRCLEAANGTEALDVLRQRGDEINAVVTDVVMPGMGGKVLADRLATLRPRLPVLFMSAHADDEVIRRGLLAPGVPFVQKPFAPAVLARKLRELLDRTGESPGGVGSTGQAANS